MAATFVPDICHILEALVVPTSPMPSCNTLRRLILGFSLGAMKFASRATLNHGATG
ncbi:hypothetical protein ACGF5C_22655 [Micromonospora sp. NPDC047620]|uniref:hypothetical protein n=1 Tax=Micromonospora sp. NPDC047620 TaxID=3364251 RepID=UPI003712E1A9